MVALGKFRESATGDIEPRTVLILVEWESKEAFDRYCGDMLIRTGYEQDHSWVESVPERSTADQQTSVPGVAAGKG